MALAQLEILNQPSILAELRQAWQDSNPGADGGHEEGGFVLRNSEGNFSAARWKKGEQDTIILPLHKDCRVNESDIVASFHTHPNTGSDYLQEPSETDKRAVRDDPNLKGKFYMGELVLSQAKIYLIAPSGQVSEIGERQQVLGKE